MGQKGSLQHPWGEGTHHKEIRETLEKNVTQRLLNSEALRGKAKKKMESRRKSGYFVLENEDDRRYERK